MELTWQDSFLQVTQKLWSFPLYVWGLREEREGRGAECSHLVLLLSNNQLRVEGVDYWAFRSLHVQLKTLKKNHLNSHFTCSSLHFYSAVGVPVVQVSCQHLTITCMLAHGSLMGHQGENYSKGPPKTSAWVSNCEGSPPCVLILRNTELNVNTLPLQRALRSKYRGWG